MASYELMFIVKPELDEEQVTTATDRVHQLVVGTERKCQTWSVEAALGAVHVSGGDGGADVLHRQAIGGEPNVRKIASRMINGLRDRGILIGAAGPYGSTLKIRPPLCFTRENADMVVSACDAVLGDISAA